MLRTVTADEAIRLIREGVDVMAASYDMDCPNVDEHVNGVCECWDGLTEDDVDTWTDADGTVDVASFSLWGPFQVWDAS